MKIIKRKRQMWASLFLFLLPFGTLAQVYSGSDGRDGALDFSGINITTNIVIDMHDHTNGIYQYSYVNIPATVTVSFNINSNNSPVTWLVQSNVTISGVVNLAGHAATGIPFPANPCYQTGGLGGPGGWSGGNGGMNGLGPGGGIAPGAGGYGTVGGNPFGGTGGPVYGNTNVFPLMGGSGGGGGGSYSSGGGGGGGAILIVTPRNIQINGVVDARGMLGFYSGGGSGGAIKLVAANLSGNGRIDCNTNQDGGGLGRVRIGAIQNTFSGTIAGVSTLGFDDGTNMTIINQPLSQTNLPGPGQTSLFTVGVYGVHPIYFQWWFNDMPLIGATNQSLLLSNIYTNNQGAYSVIISNASKTIVSSNAFLTVLDVIDSDSDGIPNYWEEQYGLSPTNALDAGSYPPAEAQPNKLTYLDKYLNGLNPLTPDTDGDGRTDYEELFVFHSNPLLSNSAGDGIPDGWRIQYGLDPAIANANTEIGSSGVTYWQIYQYNLAHTNQLDPRNPFPTGSPSLYEAINSGQITNKFSYDRNDRLRGMESSRGVSFAYVYDGNDNITGQAVLSRASETNGLPALWRYLYGLTNSAYADSDGDGWTDYQEWQAGSNPTNALDTPNLLGNPGTNIASLVLPFTPSNFVVGVGQLDGSGAEEVVIGADGNPGTNNNFMLVLTQQGAMSWSTQRVDVGAFGVTSIAVGQVTNRSSSAIYAGLRGATNGSGCVMEFVNAGASWQSNLVVLSTNEAAFVLGVLGQNVLVSLAKTNAADGALYAATTSSNIWSVALVNDATSHRGLGTTSVAGSGETAGRSLRLLDAGGLETSGFYSGNAPTNQGVVAWYPFNGSANDLISGGHNGVISGAIQAVDRFNIPGRAYAFDGTNSWIDAPGFAFANQSFSITAWIFRKQLPPGAFGICFGYGDPIDPYFQRGLHIGFRSSDAFTFAFYGDDLNTGPLNDYDEWHFWAMTFDATTRVRRLYRDGVLATNDISAAPFIGTGVYLHMGKNPYNQNFFKGSLDDVGIYNRALTSQEVMEMNANQSVGYFTLPEPTAAGRLTWSGLSLSSGLTRRATANGSSIFYSFADDKNTNGVVDVGDDFVTAEYSVAGTNVSILTESRQRIASATVGQSYGLAAVNFLNATNEVLFTGEPDGQVFAWTATGTNPLQRQSFSAHHIGKGWHALAGVETLNPGEGLAGLRVDPASPNRCDVIFWEPQFTLPEITSLPQTAPAAVVLPSTNALGSQAFLSVRLWDAEGNASTPFLQYQVFGSTNWLDATLTTLDGTAYSTTNKVAASPGGVNHVVVWNAQANLGANFVTNVLLRVRAQDFSMLGDWAIGTPFQVNMGASQDSDGDGIPDAWELAMFEDLSHGAATDTDGDGMTDFAEYIADTNPTNAALNLRITSAQLIPGGFVLNWQGGNAATQFVQREFGPFTNLWQNIWTSLPPTPVSGSYTDGFATNGPALFRIQVTR